MTFPERIESGGVVLTLTPDEVYVEFTEKSTEDDVHRILRRGQLSPVEVDDPAPLEARTINDTSTNRRWLRIPPDRTLDETIAELNALKEVVVVSPVYHRPDLPRKTGLALGSTVLVRLEARPAPRGALATMKRLTAARTARLVSDELQLYALPVPDPKNENALDYASKLAQNEAVKSADADWMQLTLAISTTTPNDTDFGSEWDMTQIGCPQGWDLSTGNSSVIIAIVDTGCDLNHEDLSSKYVAVADRRDVIAGTNTPNDDYGHGTCCAGIAAAHSNNALGVAGVAWGCQIMPIRALQNGSFRSESDIVAAIDWARTHGANVVSMSWHWDGPHANADTAFTNAHAAGLVLVAASGNSNIGSLNYPATHSAVMAVGASDRADHRKSPASPDGETWGSQFGPGLSVTAPGVQCFTTDQSGNTGFNTNNGGPITWAGVNYPSSGSADGNYVALMNGTSAATPHVAGLAGLLLSLYPGLSNDQVRQVIEKTAEKVGGYAYMQAPSHPSGEWANEMGYGRINVSRALDFADVIVKDAPADTGVVPYTGGPFWESSDIVVRPNDDDVFTYHAAVRGQTNYIYVRVQNQGPAEARNVTVSVRAVAYPGSEFVYPADWTAVDATHLQPSSMETMFATLPAGAAAIAKFSIDAAQVNSLYGWETGGWHPCILAEVHSDNDYATAVGVHSFENNNLAQRNISTVPATAGSFISYPFVIGHPANEDLYVELLIDRSELAASIELLLNPCELGTVFPALRGLVTPLEPRDSATLLGAARVSFVHRGRTGTLTLPAGTTIHYDWERNGHVQADCLKLTGAEWVSRQGSRMIAITAERASIAIQKIPHAHMQMSLHLNVPKAAQPGDHYGVRVAQVNPAGQVVGGVTLQVEVD
jgi:subtilisin family serine protease